MASGDAGLSAGAGATTGGERAGRDEAFVGEAFADHVLLSVLHAPGASRPGLAGRTAAGLLRLLLAEGASDEVTGFLAPFPGEFADFDLVDPEPDEADSHTVISRADIGTVIEEAWRRARAGRVEVHSVSEHGVRRLALRADGTGALSYVQPAAEHLHGDETARSEAWARWQRLLDRDRGPSRSSHRAEADGAPADRPDPAAADPAAADPAAADPAAADPAAADPAAADPAALVEAMRQALSELTLEIDEDAIEAAVQRALGEVSVEVDLTAVETMIRAAVADAFAGARPVPSPAAEPPSPGPAPAAPALDADRLADLRPVVTAAVDAAVGTALEKVTTDLVHRSDLVAVQSLIQDSLRAILAGTEDVAASAAAWNGERIATQIARMVAAEVGSGAVVQSESGSWVAQATLVSIADQLHVQLESFNDRVRAGSRSLEALADELASRERSTAQAHDQLARSVEASFQRLAQRVESRLEELTLSLPARTGTDRRPPREVGELLERVSRLLERLPEGADAENPL